MAIVSMLTNEQMREAVRLADDTFRDAEHLSMGEAFPFIFSDAMMHLSFGAFEHGKLLSFMGLVPWTIRIGEARLRVFSLGAVCTHPEARGKGIASEVLAEVYAYVRRAGASLLLVSGDRTLYTRTGCAHFGRTRRYGWDEATADVMLAAVGASASPHIREMEVADIYRLNEVASARAVRYDFGVNELAMLIKGEAQASCMKMKHRTLVAEDKGKVSAFAVIGVPKDPRQRGQLMEYAGDAADVVRLIAYAVQSFGMAGLDGFVPWHETELHTLLSGVPSTEENHMGTIRIMDGQALVCQLQPWFDGKAPGAAAGLRLEEKEDGSWQLQNGSKTFALSANELVGLVFDCACADGDGIMPDRAEVLNELFPVPFPYPGGLAFI